MKKLYYTLSLILCMSIGQNCFATAVLLGGDGMGNRKFSRTYVKNFEVSRNSRARMASSSDIIVSKEQFESHLEAGKKRLLHTYDQPIEMDLGVLDFEDGAKQTWTLPDLREKDFYATIIDQTTPESTGVSDYFDMATNAVTFPGDDLMPFQHQLYEVSDNDLFYYGYTEGEGENIEPVDYYITMTPVPLTFGDNFLGVVTFIYEEDPDYDSTEYWQHYEVIGQGTMNTYDDGPVEMIKLAFTEEIYDYKDGNIVDAYEYDEIVWYGPSGHYIRAGLSDKYSENKTTLEYIEYQRLASDENILSVTKTLSEIKHYPNPVKSGQQLTFNSKTPLPNSSVHIMDINGRLLCSLVIESSNKIDTYSVTVPEELVSGMYLYKVVGADSKTFASGRLVLE